MRAKLFKCKECGYDFYVKKLVFNNVPEHDNIYCPRCNSNKTYDKGKWVTV